MRSVDGSEIGMMSARALAALCLAGCLILAPAVARTQDPPAGSTHETAAAPANADSSTPASSSAALAAQRAKTEADLRRISDEITLSRETAVRLDAEMTALAADRDRIRTAMISAAADQKRISAEISASEGRIGSLADEEGSIKASLRERRGVLAEVLGALERMGRKPPPALLVKPGDALGSVRSAILLGAVVPEIRSQTDALLKDLNRLVAVKNQLAAEKQTFAEALGRGLEEEVRLSRLLTEKQKLEAENRGRIGDENRRASELAAEATSLQELIASLETETARVRQAEELERRAAADAAKAAAEARERAAQEALKVKPTAPSPRATPTVPEVAPDAPAGETQQYDIAQLRRDMARMEPSAAFSTLRGSLVPPVAGRQVVKFGQVDGIGRSASGATFKARAGDVVTAPAEGQILYSGPFRSYGQLLILNAGDGYHVVMAGMSRIDVAVGQFVLSGEPLAVMGALRVASAAEADMSNAGPSLYVEFRKDGKPVDPSPWWTDGSSGRTRNDT